MRIHAISAPSNELGDALARFERQFTYPLGTGQSFRISHGEDYSSFFRSIGEGICFVAEEGGEILGTIGGAIRRLLFPDGKERDVLYLGDLKAAVRLAGRTLLQLADAMFQWASPKVTAAYCVVMDGTRATPARYTGRFGIPAFEELGKVAVLRIEIDGRALTPDACRDVYPATAADVDACFVRLNQGRYAGLGGEPPLRSEMEPHWRILAEAKSCGRIEDTRRAKRLWVHDGAELLSAHLSSFAYESLAAGVQLVQAAIHEVRQRGFPALFLTVPVSDSKNFAIAMGSNVVMVPATIYGTGFDAGGYWNINTAEI